VARSFGWSPTHSMLDDVDELLGYAGAAQAT